jgi:hypothetical protein
VCGVATAAARRSGCPGCIAEPGLGCIWSLVPVRNQSVERIGNEADLFLVIGLREDVAPEGLAPVRDRADLEDAVLNHVDDGVGCRNLASQPRQPHKVHPLGRRDLFRTCGGPSLPHPKRRSSVPATAITRVATSMTGDRTHPDPSPGHDAPRVEMGSTARHGNSADQRASRCTQHGSCLPCSLPRMEGFLLWSRCSCRR